jgi:hypothetical protein
VLWLPPIKGNALASPGQTSYVQIVGSLAHPALVCPPEVANFVLYHRAVLAEPTAGVA